MADFQIAYNITVIGNEGGLNPGKGEAFTYRGIDESKNPHWAGFAIVHDVWDNNRHLGISAVNKILAENKDLQNRVQSFYIANYWNTHLLGKISDQKVANNVFDASVNPCIDTASLVLQKACNEVISANNLVYHPLVPDGVIGENTLAIVNELNGGKLFNAINTIRETNYKERVKLTPEDALWYPYWKKRLIDY